LVVDGEEEVDGFGEVVGLVFAGPVVEVFEGDVDGCPVGGGEVGVAEPGFVVVDADAVFGPVAGRGGGAGLEDEAFVFGEVDGGAVR